MFMFIKFITYLIYTCNYDLWPWTKQTYTAGPSIGISMHLYKVMASRLAFLFEVPNTRLATKTRLTIGGLFLFLHSLFFIFCHLLGIWWHLLRIDLGTIRGITIWYNWAFDLRSSASNPLMFFFFFPFLYFITTVIQFYIFYFHFYYKTLLASTRRCQSDLCFMPSHLEEEAGVSNMGKFCIIFWTWSVLVALLEKWVTL
jgi:hypothetical protein